MEAGAMPGGGGTERHTDIRAGGWVARLPAGWQPYALLARLDRPIGIWLLFLPGLWGILLGARSGFDGVRLSLLFAIGSVVMRAAGCVINDLWDREIDRKVARTAGRPLAAGMLSPRQALRFLAALMAVGLLILVQLGWVAQALGVASMVLVALYPLAKRVTWWPQLVMGFTFGYGAPMGYAAAVRHIDPAWLALYAAAILWDLGFDTIYAHQDREDDAVIGVRSTARLFGPHTAIFLGGVFALMMIALLLVGVAAGLSPWFYPALLPVGVLLGRQVRVLDIHDPAQCLALFRGHREIGLLVAAAILIGRALA